MNSAEFAESQGFSRPYVTKLVQQGVIVRDAKGQIDKDAAVAALAARREPAKSLRRGRPAHNGEISAPACRRAKTLSTMLLKSRIKTEVERGKLAELDRRQREGELVERSEIEEAAFSKRTQGTGRSDEYPGVGLLRSMRPKPIRRRFTRTSKTRSALC